MVNGLRADARAGVDDVHLHLAALGRQIDDDLARPIGEFHRIVRQVIDHLEDGVVIGGDLQLVRNVQRQVDLLVGELFFKAQHDAAHHFADVKGGFV